MGGLADRRQQRSNIVQEFEWDPEVACDGVWMGLKVTADRCVWSLDSGGREKKNEMYGSDLRMEGGVGFWMM